MYLFTSDSNIDIPHVSSPLDRYLDIASHNHSVDAEANYCHLPHSTKPRLPYLVRDWKRSGTPASEIRIKRQMSNKERWQPLYPKRNDPETVSMLGYEFANDVIHGHVPPSPLLPAPCQSSNRHDIPQTNEGIGTREHTISRDQQGLKIYDITQNSPPAGAASTKVSTVSTRRSKRKVRKSRRIRNQIRDRWQRRLAVFNSGLESRNDSYDRSNNDKISGYVGNRAHRNTVADDVLDSELLRKRFQISETTLLEEIWTHLRLLVERSSQGQHCLHFLLVISYSDLIFKIPC